MTDQPAAFDPALVTIERKRRSVTQGDVVLSYNGTRLGGFEDKFELDGGTWNGRSDEYWLDVAKRFAVEQGLAVEPHVLDRGEVLDAFRQRVLAALDDVARDEFARGYGVELPCLGVGALDEDLPELFRAIDAQVDRIVARIPRIALA